MSAQLDHLVVAAATLEQGVAWCEATLGVTPGPGGQHALMGTHNRVLSIASAAHPRSYLEIIAIDPQAAPPGRARWFDLDDEALQAAVTRQPQLIHWVVRCADMAAASQALQGQGFDVGRVLSVSRPTPTGMLQWQVAVRDDGRRLLRGALPTLIHWGGLHPVDHMPASGVELEALQLCLSEPALLTHALAALALSGVRVAAGEPVLEARLHTPKGPVRLHCGA